MGEDFKQMQAAFDKRLRRALAKLGQVMCVGFYHLSSFNPVESNHSLKLHLHAWVSAPGVAPDVLQKTLQGVTSRLEVKPMYVKGSIQENLTRALRYGFRIVSLGMNDEERRLLLRSVGSIMGESDKAHGNRFEAGVKAQVVSEVEPIVIHTGDHDDAHGGINVATHASPHDVSTGSSDNSKQGPRPAETRHQRLGRLLGRVRQAQQRAARVSNGMREQDSEGSRQ